MNYKELATKARRKILQMVHEAGTSHIASNFSVVDIATVLYENLKPGDEVCWSKGWAAATIYYFLAKQGKIPVEDLDKFGKEIDGKIPYLGLAETSTPGVHVNSGSMGHGLPVAVGMALAKKRAGDPGIIYCIMSDGEMNEGTTWESAMLAAHHQLDNLIVIIDKNKWQAMGKTEDVINLDPLEARWEGFEWEVMAGSGHDYVTIDAFITSNSYHGRPTAIIFNTIKGAGVSFFENHLLYHYKHVETEEFERALKELQA